MIAAVVVIGVLCLALVGGTVYWVIRHVDTQFTSTDTAAGEFTRARARFTGRQPLVELQHDQPVLHRNPSGERSSSARLQTVQALAFDRKSGKLVRASFPFWLLQMRASFSFLPEMGAVTVEDLERHGPGLIIDFAETDSQVLVWTE